MASPKSTYQHIKPYIFLFVLITSILLGGLTGYLLGPEAIVLKPFGDIFLNLLFTVVVPLVFFSISSAIASMGDLKRVWKIMSATLGAFLFTSVIAALFMIVVVIIFPPALGVSLVLPAPEKIVHMSLGAQLADIFTVADFFKLFSRDHILALILFAVLVGLATSSSGERGKPFAALLQSATDIAMKTVSLVMCYAPIGFFAYFAVLVAELGPRLLETYMRATLIYYPAAIAYFIVAFSGYAYLAGRKPALRAFWKQVSLPLMTSLATCSSAASIPVNLQATREMGVSGEIAEMVVPLGAILHKDGSVLGGVLKIAFLFGIFHMSFSGLGVLLSVLLVSLLVGTVMGAIPSGGMVAEVLILSLFGFPPQALIMVAAITLIIDAPATVLNVNGDSVCSMLVARLVEGRKWLQVRLINPA